jgi:ABC-type transporter Mla subunit MlaD
VNDTTPDTAVPPDLAASPAGPTATACSIGAVLADAARLAGRDEDAAEIEAIVQAMVRLLAGVPLRSDGKLTVKSLAAEAGQRRNKLTHKHTNLKDLFYGLVRAQGERPQIADDLHTANTELADKVRRLTAERDELRSEQQVMARVIHALEVENETLRKALETSESVTDLRARRRARPAVIGPC